jgi:hypothetical protein
MTLKGETMTNEQQPTEQKIAANGYWTLTEAMKPGQEFTACGYNCRVEDIDDDGLAKVAVLGPSESWTDWKNKPALPPPLTFNGNGDTVLLPQAGALGAEEIAAEPSTLPPAA